MDKKVLKNQFKKVIAVLLSISLCIPSFDIFRMQEDVHAAEIHTLQNPVIETDSSMTAGQKVTWDCIWFGSYPQSEVLTTTMEEPIDSKIQNGDDFIKDDALYQKLQNATTWDANGDTTIDGEKYRRIQKSDATYATTGSENYYNWSREGYHYFKYQPIKWQVLETKDGKVFLLSNDSLDAKRYHEKSEAVTWATSTIRSWLNGYSGSYNQLSIDYSSKNFIGTAFSTEEQRLIQSTNIKNDDNIEYGTEGGEDTNDKIFLLSQSEVYTDNAKKYGFSSSKGNFAEARRKKSSTFSKAMGTWSSTNDTFCFWWLRSPGYDTCYASYGSYFDWSYDDSDDVDVYSSGVCPALNLNLSSTNLYQYAGTVCSDGTVNEVAPVQTAEQETTTENVQTTISTSQLPTTTGNYTTKPQVTEYTPTTTQVQTITNRTTATPQITTTQLSSTNAPTTVMWATTTQRETTTNSPTIFQSTTTQKQVMTTESVTTNNPTTLEANQTTTADGSVQSVQMDIQNISVEKGDTFFLTYQVTPANAVIHNVSWRSSDNNVVMVDSEGLAMARGAGTAIIAVIIDGKTSTTTVKVVDKDNPETTVPSTTVPATTIPATTLPVTSTAQEKTTNPTTITSTTTQPQQTTISDGSVQSVQMDNQSVAVVKGNTFFLTYQVTPANAVIHNVSWKSSNNNVVMVDSNGVAMAVGTGMATIAVIIDGKTATTAVTVVDIDNPETTTLASTTPASTTPASTTPASTTPASTTPASTTPASTTPASTTPGSTTPVTTTPATTTLATTMPETTLPATSTTQGQTTVETSTTEAVTSVVASTSGTPATTEQPTTAQVTTTEPPLTTEQSPTTEPPLTTEQPTTAQQPATPEQPITTGQPLTTMQMPTTMQPQTTTRRQEQPTATRPVAVNTTKKKQNISVKSSIEKTYSSKRFSMNAKTNGDGKLTYKSSNKKVAKVSSKGIVSMTGYGKTTITVSAPETNYYKAAKKKVTLMVRPVQGKIKQLKHYTDGMVKISWEKDKRATGYAIQISTDGKFKGKKMQRYFDKNSTSVSISLVKGKKYYIRIRNYKNGSGVYNFGSWSKVKIY